MNFFDFAKLKKKVYFSFEWREMEEMSLFVLPALSILWMEAAVNGYMFSAQHPSHFISFLFPFFN